MKHFGEFKGMDDVLITFKFIPTLSAGERHVSYDLTRLITQKGSCGERRHLYSSLLPSVGRAGVRARGPTLTSTVQY